MICVATFASGVERIRTGTYEEMQNQLQPKSLFSYGMTVDQVALVFENRIQEPAGIRVGDLAQHLLGLCETYRIEPALILSLIHVESSFRVHAVSRAGAVGLMQLMPLTARAMAKSLKISYRNRKELKDPFLNLTLGVAYLAHLRGRYQGRLHYYLAAYNMGPSRLFRLMAHHDKTGLHKIGRYAEAVRRGIHEMNFYVDRLENEKKSAQAKLLNTV